MEPRTPSLGDWFVELRRNWNAILVLITLLLATLAAPPIVALEATPEGAQVLAASQAGVEVRSADELKVVRTLPTMLVNVHDLAFSSDGKTLAICGGSPAESGAIELWDWPARTLRRSRAAGGDVVYSVAWSPDGKRLSAACADRKVRIFPVGGDEADGAEPRIVEPHSAAALATCWLPAGDLILSAGVDQSIRVLDPATGEVRRTLDNHTADVRDLAVRPGKYPGPAMVASCGADRTVRFWQPAIGRLVRFARLPVRPTAIVWTPSGSHLLAVCEDGRVVAIDPATTEQSELAAAGGGWLHSVVVLPAGDAAITGDSEGRLRRVPLDAIKP
jgi:WD40 repeat protein